MSILKANILKGNNNQKLDVVIPAAGRQNPLIAGAREQGEPWASYIEETPKGLLQINDKHVIEYLFDHLETHDEIETVYIVTNLAYDPKYDAWARDYRNRTKKQIFILNNGKSNGECGNVADFVFGIEEADIKNDIIVFGTDKVIYPEFDFDGFLDFSLEKKSPVTVVHEANGKDPKNHGVVILDENNKIIYFKEKTPTAELTTISVMSSYFPAKILPDVINCVKEGFKDPFGKLWEYLIMDLKTNTYGFKIEPNVIGDVGRIKNYMNELEKHGGIDQINRYVSV